MIVKLNTTNLYRYKIVPWSYVYNNNIRADSWFEINEKRDNRECWDFEDDKEALIFVMKYSKDVFEIT